MEKIYQKALRREFLSSLEAYSLYENAPLADLCHLADTLRREIKGDNNIVTWQIDRNVNITNACVSGCRFCNFHCKPHQKEKIFITSIEEYKVKIAETLALGGDQLLLQGGMHPQLDINYYETLFRELKRAFPVIKLHALGPPEVFHIAKISRITVRETLERLINAGLTSLPGAGAEILNSDVRHKVSPAKCNAEEWLAVMREAHRQGLYTSATMMYGHIESRHDRIDHMIKIRDLQAQKADNEYGFLSFIPWVFCSTGTELEKIGVKTDNSSLEYLRIIAMSRIVMCNIDNIQASWLTMGAEVGQLCLHAGANDLGSIMIEENVVSSAGATNRLDKERMQQIIIDAGFIPRLRDQKYQFR